MYPQPDSILRQLVEPFALSDEELQAFSESLQQPSSRSIRLGSRVDPNNLPFQTIRVPWYSDGNWLSDPSLRPSQFLEYARGDYFIQDAGSLLALAVLDPAPHETICDLCAAPGGKASGILEKLSGPGWLLANEPIQSRIDVLRWSLDRIGNPRYAISNRDPEKLVASLDHRFDAILVDAPCSGQTLWSRGKRGENAFAPDQIQHAVQRQRRILLSAIELLKPGGRLIYSTCTFTTLENEEQIDWLQSTFKGCFIPITRPGLSKWKSPLNEGCYRLWPHRDGCDGSFAAGLQLINELPVSSTRSFASNQKDIDLRHDSKNRRAARVRPREQSDANQGSSMAENMFGALHDLAIASRSPWSVGWDRQIQASLTDNSYWPIQLWKEQSGHLVPEHALAMLGHQYFHPQRTVALDDSQAWSYMRGSAILGLDAPLGWTVATWKDGPLGWLKVSRERANNVLPKIGRINS